MDEKSFVESEKIIEEFFEKLEINVEINQNEWRDGVLHLSFITNEPQVLIGEHGRTLAELQKILGKLIRKKMGGEIFIDIDINQYKESKNKYLTDLAMSFADDVLSSGREKALFPMPSYERRIIHLALKGRKGIITESEGEGWERKVIIKPV